jgi:cytochrome P450
MTRPEIIKLSANFIIGGSEPTATTLCGGLYYLLKDPQTLQRLTEEIRKDFTDPEEMTFKKLENHKYLEACVQETLRIYPGIPSMLPRRTVKGGAFIDGVYIPENVSPK